MPHLAYYSDLHLEASGVDLDAAGADLVVVVGDVEAPHPRHCLSDPQSEHNAVWWLRARFPDQPVLYVPGNHDYEGKCPTDALAAMRRAAQGSNVSVLWNDALTIDGVRYIGTPLWTDPTQNRPHPEEVLAAVQMRTDLGRAFDEQRRPLTGQWLIAQHHNARAFIAAELAAHQDCPTVVLTHWAPSVRSQALPFQLLDIGGYWASDCEDLVQQATLWIHGHIHDTVHYRIGADPTRGEVYTNPRGFCRTFGLAQNPAFDPCARINVCNMPSPQPNSALGRPEIAKRSW